MPVSTGLLARVQMIDAAQKTLDLQYFIFRGDATGQLILDALTRAADRGVSLRLLIDDGDTVEGDERVVALRTQAGVEVRVFNPFRYRGHNRLLRALEFLGNSTRLDYRMHNKLLVVDNSLALIGGRNIGNEYFQVDPQAQSAAMTSLSQVPWSTPLSGTFDEYWNSEQAVPAEALSPERGRAILPRAPRAQVDGVDFSARIASGEPFASLLEGRLELEWAAARDRCATARTRRRPKAGDRPKRHGQGFSWRTAPPRSEKPRIPDDQSPYIVPTAEVRSNMLY